MESKELLIRFGKTDLFFSIAVILCTKRVKEPEKSYLLKDDFNFGELILEIETEQPVGIFRNKNFFFGLNNDNLEEAKSAFKKGEIANWYVRRSESSDFNFRSFIDRLDSQAI